MQKKRRKSWEKGDRTAVPLAWQPMRRGFFRDPFSLLSDSFFDGFASRLLTEFPAPGNTLREAQEAVEQPREEANLLSEEESRSLDLQRRRNALQLHRTSP